MDWWTTLLSVQYVAEINKTNAAGGVRNGPAGCDGHFRVGTETLLHGVPRQMPAEPAVLATQLPQDQAMTRAGRLLILRELAASSPTGLPAGSNTPRAFTKPLRRVHCRCRDLCLSFACCSRSRCL